MKRLLLAAAACAVAVAGTVAVAHAGGQGRPLPAYTDGYARWIKLNARPIVSGGPHDGVKNVYASRPRSGRLFPEGTVIVKTIASRDDAAGAPRDVAVMRKVRGTWQWVEYRREPGGFGVLASGRLCASCHAQAKASDWVFTRR